MAFGNYLKASKEKIQERREDVSSLIARGITRPSRIVQELKSNYDGYNRGIALVNKDIKAVETPDTARPVSRNQRRFDSQVRKGDKRK